MVKLKSILILSLLMLSKTAAATMAEDIQSINSAAAQRNQSTLTAKLEAIEQSATKKEALREVPKVETSPIPVAGQPAPAPQNYPAPVPGAKAVDIFNAAAAPKANNEPAAQPNIYR